MTDVQRNKITMYRGVLTVLDASTDNTAAVPAVKEATEKFRSIVAAIDMHAETQANGSKAKTTAKLDSERILRVRLNRTRAVLHAEAHSTGNQELITETGRPESYYKNLPDEQLLKQAVVIHALAVKHAGLISTAVNGRTIIDELKIAIDQFAAALGEREMSVAVRKSSRGQLAHRISEADKHLANCLDNLLELFRDSDPNLYDAYFAARETKNLGPRRRKNDGNDGPQSVTTEGGGN